MLVFSIFLKSVTEHIFITKVFCVLFRNTLKCNSIYFNALQISMLAIQMYYKHTTTNFKYILIHLILRLLHLGTFLLRVNIEFETLLHGWQTKHLYLLFIKDYINLNCEQSQSFRHVEVHHCNKKISHFL